MPYINMIFARTAEKRKLEERVRIAILLVLGSIVIGLGIVSFMTARVYSTGKDIERVNDQLAKVQPIVDSIGQYENDTSKLMPRLQLLTESRDQTLQWCNALQDIGRDMADKTWLASLTTTTRIDPAVGGQPAQTSTMINMRGVSATQSLVGETMLRLNQSPLFKAVNLDFTQKKPASDIDALDFAINVQLAPVKTADKGASGNAGD